MKSGGKPTLKALGGEGKLSEENGEGSPKAKKLPSTDDKMTPDSPTCAIDADELIMRGKIGFRRAGQAGGEKDKVVGFSALTPVQLFAKVAPSSLEAPLPPPPPPPPPRQPPPAVTPKAPYSEPVPVPSCTSALKDSNFLLLVQLDRPGRSSEANEPGKVATKRMEAKVAPEPAPAAFAAAPVVPAPSSARAVAAALAPPLAGAAPVLGDSNFLLLAEFAHVVQDTLALRGIQVQQFFPSD